MQHDSGRYRFVAVEDRGEDLNDEFHGSEVVVVQNYLVHRGLFRFHALFERQPTGGLSIQLFIG